MRIQSAWGVRPMPDNSVMANSGYTNPAGHTITGTLYGVELGTAGVITNQGAIYATDGTGVEINAAGSFINGAGAVSNGSVHGHVYNSANAYFAGGLFGLDITGAGNVTNDGTFASSLGVGIEITGAALVTNEAQSAINGFSYGIDALAGATIENFGFVTASGGTGIRVGAAGEVINETGGTISGALYGVDMVGVATVENAGMISGGSFAVLIGPAAGQLVVDAGGVFVGKVEDAGGGGGIELTAGTPGSVGSLDLGFFRLLIDQFRYRIDLDAERGSERSRRQHGDRWVHVGRHDRSRRFHGQLGNLCFRHRPGTLQWRGHGDARHHGLIPDQQFQYLGAERRQHADHHLLFTRDVGSDASG